MKRQARKGAISAEVGILIGIILLVVALVLMVFYNNVKNATVNSGLNNNVATQAGGGTTTAYTAENRDYASSQIDVQTMGAQGLEMLRRKANNMAIDIIEKTTAEEEANDIAYLSKALEIITGEPNICTNMKEDTDKHCDEFSEYKYKNTLASNITIQYAGEKQCKMTDTGRTDINGTKYVSLDCSSITVVEEYPLTSAVANAMNMTVYKNNSGYPTATTEEKIEALKTLTESVYKDISKNVVLIEIDVDKEYNAGNGIDSAYSETILSALAKLKERMDNFSHECDIDPITGFYQNAICWNSNTSNSLTLEEYNNFNYWYDNLIRNINPADTEQNIAKLIKDAITANPDIITILQKDTLDINSDDDAFAGNNLAAIMNEIIASVNKNLSSEEAIAELIAESQSRTAKDIASDANKTKSILGLNEVVKSVSSGFDNTGGVIIKECKSVVDDTLNALDKLKDIKDNFESTLDQFDAGCDVAKEYSANITANTKANISEAREIVEDVYADEHPVVNWVIQTGLNIADYVVTKNNEMFTKTTSVIQDAVRWLKGLFNKS